MPKARSAYVKKRRQFRGNRYFTKKERKENIQTTCLSDDVQNKIMSEPESSPQPSASA